MVSPIEGFPPEIQKLLTTYCSADTLGKCETVSKIFKKMIDQPKVWEQVAKKLNIKVDPHNPKDAFINLPHVNKLILDALPKDIAEPMKNLNPLAQRAAIAQLINDTDFGKISISFQRTTKDSLLELVKILSERITGYNEGKHDKAALIFLYSNGALRYGGSVYDEDLLEKVTKDFDILQAYLEGMQKKGHTGTLLEDTLRRAIEQEDPKFVKAVMDAGAISHFGSLADAIVKIALAGDQREKVISNMAPIFHQFKPNSKMGKVIREAQEMADKMVIYTTTKSDIHTQVWQFLKR